jgi:hypothetical protein
MRACRTSVSDDRHGGDDSLVDLRDERDAWSYVRLLALRHSSIIAGLLGFCLLASAAPKAARAGAAFLLLGGVLGFALSVSVLVLPLAWRLRGDRRGIVAFCSTVNELTGHSLVDQAAAFFDRPSRATRTRLRIAVAAEVLLVVAVPVVAVLSH